MKIFKLSALIAIMSVLATFASHTNAAVRFKVVQGTSCAAAETPIAITTAGGTVAASVCVVTTAAEFVCSATYPIIGSAAPATTAGVQIASLTLDPAFPNRLDITALPQTITASPTNVQLSNGVSLTGVQAGGAGLNVKIADITFTVPAGLPAATTFTYAVASTGQIETRNPASVNCNDLNNDRVSNGSGVQTFSLATPAAPTPTAPTINPIVNLTLTGGAASQNVSVATSGSNGGSLALACTIPAGTASFAITGGASRTIAAGTAVGANAPAIGLSCTPQATVQTATLSCAQTTIPAPNPAALTATITCPAVVVVVPVVAATTAPGPVTLPSYAVGSTPSSSSTTLNFTTSGGASSLVCTATGAGYSVAPSPVALTVGTTSVVTVTYTGAVVGTFTGTLTCTPTGPATGGPFVYNLSTTVQAAQVIGPTVQVPTMGTLGLGMMGLLIAGFAGFMQRRRAK